MAQRAESKHPPVPEERRRQILEILRAEGSVSIDDVRRGFGVSPMTARRDLTILAESGSAHRTHGGAVLPELAAHEDSFQRRSEQGVSLKRLLAQAVVGTINPHETVFVDSSSTAFYLVRALLEAGTSATVLTNSLPVMALAGGPEARNLELVALGGSLRRLTRSFVGVETIQAIERFAVDRMVFSVKGIEADGSLTEPDPLEAAVKRAMVARARTVQLLAESRKFDEHGLNVVAAPGAIQTAWFAGPPAARQQLFRDAGVEVRLV